MRALRTKRQVLGYRQSAHKCTIFPGALRAHEVIYHFMCVFAHKGMSNEGRIPMHNKAFSQLTDAERTRKLEIALRHHTCNFAAGG